MAAQLVKALGQIGALETKRYKLHNSAPSRSLLMVLSLVHAALIAADGNGVGGGGDSNEDTADELGRGRPADTRASRSSRGGHMCC